MPFGEFLFWVCFPPKRRRGTKDRAWYENYHIERVREKHLRLSIVGSIQVDCSNGELDPMTNAFIQMSGVFAELELRIIRERVRSGMRNAAAKGAKIGRPQTSLDDIPANFLRHYPAYKNGAFNLTE